jgi:AraC family transcriptional regulator
MTDLRSPIERHAYPTGLGLAPIPTSGPSNEQLMSVRLRLLQAEEELRSGQWLKAQQCLLTARNILDRREAPAVPALPRGGLTLRQRQRLQLFVEQHLNRNITLTELAELIGLSYSHFCRAFRQSFGQPALAYVRARRVERAKELMLSSQLPLSRIALECGLSDQAVLCKLFRRVTGEPPAAWRRGQRS